MRCDATGSGPGGTGAEERQAGGGDLSGKGASKVGVRCCCCCCMAWHGMAPRLPESVHRILTLLYSQPRIQGLFRGIGQVSTVRSGSPVNSEAAKYVQ